MIDTHAHLDFESFDQDREEVISRAFDNGVEKIINIGVDLKTSRKSVELAERHENIFATVGFHPHDAEEILNLPTEDNFLELIKLAKHKKVVAIGEIGLDYSRFKEACQIKKQKELLARQLDIAEELGLPVVIHCRKAWEDLYEIISNTNQSPAFPLLAEARNSSKPDFSGISRGQTLTKFVLHCYSGGKKDTEKFLKLPNVYFSFSGNITYPKPAERANDFAEMIKMIPLDRIMLDSDSPFLAPQIFRGKRNEPAHIRYIAAKIAEIKQISEEKTERATDKNAEKFFNIWL